MSHATLFGWRTKYDGNFVPITRSIGSPFDLAQIDQAPRRRVRENFPLRIPLERNADELGLIPVRAQLLMQARERDTRRRPCTNGTWTSQTMTRRIPISARAFYIAHSPINYARAFTAVADADCPNAAHLHSALCRAAAPGRPFQILRTVRAAAMACSDAACRQGGSVDDHARLAVAPRSTRRMSAAIRSTT